MDVPLKKRIIVVLRLEIEMEGVFIGRSGSKVCGKSEGKFGFGFKIRLIS